MSVPVPIIKLAGRWTGIKRLWFDPAGATIESDTTMSVATVAQGQFATFHYAWSYEGQAQDGLILIGRQGGDRIRAAWVDSFHSADTMMICEGEADVAGKLSASGSYAVPEGPDWGWRIDILPQGEASFVIAMYNVTPDGEAHLGVEMTYRRDGA